MEICITIDGQRHCYEVPVVDLPITIHKPGPGPVNYPWLIRDAVILAAVKAAADKVADADVREKLAGGVSAALKAVAERAGSHVSIQE
jgi:hypothetical protein